MTDARWARSVGARRARRLVVGISCLAGGACAHFGAAKEPRLVTIDLPPGFRGTWVRDTIGGSIELKDAPGPDTLVLGGTATYALQQFVSDNTDSVVRAILDEPNGAQLRNEIAVARPIPDDALVVTTRVTVKGDTVLVVSATSRRRVGLVQRVTTREYLASEGGRLRAETTTEFPAYNVRIAGESHAVAARGPLARTLVFQRVER